MKRRDGPALRVVWSDLHVFKYGHRPVEFEEWYMVEGEKRVEAVPIKRILCVRTGTVLGYLYRWNTGETEPMWFGRPSKDILYAD